MTTKFVEQTRAAGGIARLFSGIGPQIYLDAPNDGTGGDDDAAKAAAAAAKEAADKAAADAAAKKAAEEEAARLEAEKNMTEDQKEKAKLLKEVMEKKAKLKDTEAARAAAEAELKKFEGIDLDEVKKLLAEKTEREKKDLEAKGEFDRLKKMIADERAAEKTTYESTIAELKAQLGRKEGTINELTIGQNFSQSTFIKDDLVLTPAKARQLYGSHFELKDGNVIAYDKPAGAADRTPLTGADANPLPFEEALKKIISLDPDKDSLIRTKIKPGANSSSQQQLKNEKPNGQGDGLYGVSRIKAGLSAGK
jgi:hypothetical protein